MSTTGVQLNSQAQFTYFHPTIREYLQGVREGLSSNNLAAAQRDFARLNKALQSSTGDGASASASLISQGLQALGKALEAGDLSGAAQALGELPPNIQSVPEAPSSTVVSLSDGGDVDTGTYLNVKA
jgi:hypothetical protein